MNILIDFDGTLFDYDKSLNLIMKRIFGELSIEYTDNVITEYKNCMNFVFNKYRNFKSFRELNKKSFSLLLEKYCLDDTSIEEVVSKFKYSRMYTVCLYEESLQFCRIMSKKHTLIIVSNGCYKIQESLIKASRLDLYIDSLITPEIVNARKPDSEFLSKLFFLKKIKPSDSIMIGDSTEDIECAKKVGIRSIWVNRSGKEQSKYKDVYTVSNLLEVYRYLGR